MVIIFDDKLKKEIEEEVGINWIEEGDVVVPELNINERKEWICPRCKKLVKDYPAISRRDDMTDICGKCGREEAMFDLFVFSKMKEERKWLEELNDEK